MTEKPKISKSRRVTKWLLRIVAVFLGLLALLLVLILSGPGTTRTVRFALSNFMPLENARLEFDSVNGNPFTRLSFSNVRLIHQNGSELLVADSLAIGYKARSFTSNTIKLGHIRLVNPSLHAQQDSLGIWDIATIFSSDSTGEPPDIHIDGLDVVNGSLEANFYNPVRDSSLSASNLQLDLDSLKFGSLLAADARLVSGNFRAPMVESDATLLARTHINQSTITVDTLALSSERTNLIASGIIDLSDGLYPSEGSDFRLRGEPLHFADLSPIISTIDPGISGNVRVDMSASATDAIAIISGAFSDGSSINGRATRGRLPDSSFRYIFSGNTTNLLLSSFVNSIEVQPLSARVEGDLTGAALSSLTGRSSISLSAPTTLSGVAVQALSASADFVEGSATLNGSVHTDMGSVSASGNTRPFDRIPSYDITLNGEALTLDTLFPEARLHSLSAEVRVNGAGFDPDSMTTVVDGNIVSGRIGNLSLNPGQFDIRLEQALLSATASIASSAGSLAVDGSFDLGPNHSFSINQFRATGLDFAAALGDTTSSTITGSLNASGSQTSDGSWLANGSANVEELRFDVFELIDADGNFSLANDIAQVDAKSTMDSAAFDVNVTASVAGGSPALRTVDASFRNLDVDGFVPETVLATSLNGSLHVEPTSGQRLLWSARLDSSTVNQASIYQLDGDGLYAADSVTFQVETETSDGSLRTTGSVIPGQGTLVLRDASFTNVNLSAFLDNSALASSLTGTADVNVQSSSESVQRASVNATLERSTWNGLAIESTVVETDIRDGSGPVSLTARIEDGDADVRGTVNLTNPQPSYELNGSLNRIPVAQFVRDDSLDSSLNLDFEISGSGTTVGTFDADFSISADTSRYGGTVVSLLNVQGSVHNGVVQTDILELESNAVDLSASGTMGVYSDQVPSDFEIVGTLKDARPLNDFLENDFDIIGSGIFYLAITGPRGSESIQVDSDLESIVYGDFRAGRMTASVLAEVDESLSFTAFDGNLAFEHFSLPSLTVRRTDFITEMRNDSLLFDIYSTIDSRRSLTLKGSTDVNDDQRILLIEDIELVFDDDVWELLQPTTVAYQDFYEVRNLLIYTESQQIALDGILDLDGEQSLLLTVENFRAGAVADLFGFQGLDGTVNGYLDLTGPADAPVIQGDLMTTVESFGENYGDMNLIVSYDSLKLNLNGVVTNDRGGELTLDGFIPVNLRLAPSTGQTEAGLRVAAGAAQLNTESDMTVTADNFALDWILPFLDPAVYSDIGGNVTGEVSITGTVSDPDLDGDATLSDGKLGLTVFGVVYEEIGGEIAFENSIINLNHVEVRSGSGELIALGTVNMSQLNLGEFDIDLSAEDFLAVDNSQYRGSVVADLKLTGTTTQPYMSGSTTVVSGEMFMTEEIQEFDPVVLTEEDLLEVERVFGIRISEADTSTFDFVTALALDINVELERNTWFRSNSVPAMDIQLTGNLDMQKTSGEDLQIFGNIEVIPERSRITQLGKRFRIESGTLTFNGPATDPVLDVEAHYTVPNDDVTIILQVKGHLDNLEETPLASDPPMDLTDILSYLAFGRPARESLQLTGAGSETLARDIALGQATGYLEGLAGAELGFDVFEIQQSGTETRLTAGKYLTQRLFVSVSQPISFSESTELSDSMIREITAEFELIQHLLFKLTQRESLSFDLLWEYSY